MFHSARLKLTAWYLLIIMSISILFSIAFYNVSTSEIQRIINRMEFEQSRRGDDLLPRPGPRPFGTVSLDALEESKHRLVINLFIINSMILVIAGAAGYFLAGRTLRPIQLMVQEQNQFISSASHELRTPIATLRAEMEGSLLEKKLSDREARTLIKSNLEELSTLQILTNNLLRLAQVHNAKNDSQMKYISLRDVIDSAVKKITPLAKLKKITILSKIKDFRIYGDKNSLIEMFVILLDNAIKYSSEKSKITISSSKIRNHIEVHVSDQGIGIATQDLPHIFERFYRADKSRSQADGYGLGLSIARKIVKTHNGSIRAESRTKKGATFIVSLPVNS